MCKIKQTLIEDMYIVIHGPANTAPETKWEFVPIKDCRIKIGFTLLGGIKMTKIS